MPPGQRSRSRPPVVGSALLIGIGLIAAELALVTAVALFWSTFSSSAMLSAALTAGMWVAGQFGAGPSQLRSGRAVTVAAVASAERCTTCCRIFAAFDVKSQVVHGVPVAGGYIAVTLLYGAAYARCADGVGLHLLAP
jgi:hypothetical protein